MKTPEVDISQCDNAQSHCESTPPKIAFPLIEPTRCEIKQMEQDDVIEKATEPTDWCIGMVPVLKKKQGCVNLCGFEMPEQSSSA